MVVTGHLHPSASAEFEALGQHHFLAKPYTLTELGRRLRQLALDVRHLRIQHVRARLQLRDARAGHADAGIHFLLEERLQGLERPDVVAKRRGLPAEDFVPKGMLRAYNDRKARGPVEGAH